MTEVQFDLAILGLIILINFFISFIYRKYSRLKQNESKTIDFGNHSGTVSVSPVSFMPRVPFLIIYKTKSPTLRKIIIVHNLLCIIVYGLFALALFFHFK